MSPSLRMIGILSPLLQRYEVHSSSSGVFFDISLTSTSTFPNPNRFDLNPTSRGMNGGEQFWSLCEERWISNKKCRVRLNFAP
mmetsp:Transcript_25358/g.73387  ORF Transcript_25358/g.73387 Transcript_25358/m.73387 type:complete len:83 (+) Transcript_25358:176-424(+)